MQALLDQYAVTQNGFLPSSPPLACLPDPCYAPWESVIAQLPALLRDNDNAFRTAARRMPVLSTDRLQSEPEWQRAYLVLTFFTHAYIWGGDEPADVLPPPISVPLLRVAAYLELPPVATYAALNLWNFRSTSPAHRFDDLDALQALHTFTGTESESWFYVVSVAMECRAASIIPVLLAAMASPGDTDATASALRQFVACIQDVGRLLDRMHERCDPQVFFWEIRPYLAGSKNMAAQGLPDGVFYDEGTDDHGRQHGSWRQLRGGSNGQSSLLQFFDIVLGVEHHSNGTAAVAPLGFHKEVRGYMPGPHRRFLEHVGSLTSLRQAVDGAPGQLVSAFQDATNALAAFRSKHLAIVTRYIVLPSKQKRTGPANSSGRGLAGTPQASSTTPLYAYSPSRPSTEPHAPPEKFTGTGGTDLLPFLRQTRDETLSAGQSLRQAA